MNRKFAFLFTLFAGLTILIAYFNLGNRFEPILYMDTVSNGIHETAAQNIVTGIYLNYRIFDTLFEALLLLVSVIGVSQFSNLSDREQKYFVETMSMSNRHCPSEIVGNSLKIIYPIIFAFGLYVIITGSDSPGGGFQGGAIIASIVMCSYLTTSKIIIEIDMLEKVEKIVYILILATVTLFLFKYNHFETLYLRIYLIAMNLFIGIKVFCGFTVIFFHFIGIRDKVD